MNYLLLSRDTTTDRQEEAPDVSLGGCFYDFLRSTDGELIGIRYWLIESVKFEEHPVYSQFLGDGRFAFDQAGNYVDIVFDERNVAFLRSESITVETVQDFGGERVVRCGEQFGIALSISDDWQ